MEQSATLPNVYFPTAFESRTVEWAMQKTHEFTKLMAYFKCAIMRLETKCNVLNEEFSLQFDRQPISSVRTRLKKPVSICRKLERRGLPVTVQSMEENLFDIAGVRIICSFLDDVYTVADALLRQDDMTLIERKDYIAHPKVNGYRSLHLLVAIPIFLQQEKRTMKAEIQLRTIAMDAWASLEHQIRYKKDIAAESEVERELSYCAALSAELDTRMDCLRAHMAQQREHEAPLEYRMAVGNLLRSS